MDVTCQVFNQEPLDINWSQRGSPTAMKDTVSESAAQSGDKPASLAKHCTWIGPNYRYNSISAVSNLDFFSRIATYSNHNTYITF